MSDRVGRTMSSSSTSLAITEKRVNQGQRPGGCVGIFFQLFDWNRRFAKKKLFSKKLLPPIRSKHSSKKFGGDDKLPKLRLIADENSGGFPSLKKNGASSGVESEQKNEIQAPSLVARLMGLESMPTVQRDSKPRKASFTGMGSYKGDTNKCNGFVEGDLNLESVRTNRHELRPQKLQKTGLSERLPVTRFGSEALQLKSMLSRSKKHQPKLSSPVKSPRNFSGRNASRLIVAATRILEPGLQKSRAKCALTYGRAAEERFVQDNMSEQVTYSSPDQPKNSAYHMPASTSLAEESSCRSCAHLLNVEYSGSVEEHVLDFSSPASSYMDPPCHQLERVGCRLAKFSSERTKEDRVYGLAPFSQSAVMNNVRPCAAGPRKPLNPEREVLPISASQSQECKRQNNVISVRFNNKSRRQNQILQGRDRISPRSKSSSTQNNKLSAPTNGINEVKDFVALNKNMSGRSRSRSPAKMGSGKFDSERKFGNIQNDCLSPARKRRSLNVSHHADKSGPQLTKPTNISSLTVSEEEVKRTAQNTTRTCSDTGLNSMQESISGDGVKGNNVVSFTFSSPMKYETGVSEGSVRKRAQNDSKLKPEENSGTPFSDKRFHLSGDTLGAILEQKLKELTCQEEDELMIGGNTPRKTTAMILQELISALTMEKPCHENDLTLASVNEDNSNNHCHISAPTASITSQAKRKSVKSALGYSHDIEHLSPGSVLEASFSNDSCLSSVDDTAEYKFADEHMDFKCKGEPLSEPEADISDSATSLTTGNSGGLLVSHLLDSIADVIFSLNLDDASFKGIKLIHARDVMLNSELVFGNSALPGSAVKRGFRISCFLCNELDRLASVIRMNFSGFLGFEDSKERNQLKRFVFDCIIEYLDSRIGRYSKSGFKSWTRLPLCANTEMFICEIVEEVRRWTQLAGLIPDDLIELDMSHSLGKWTEFEIEAFETSMEIDCHILQNLVDELVVDLCDSRLLASYEVA